MMKTMRKAVSWLLVLMMIISTSVSFAESKNAADQINVERKTVTAYFGSMEADSELSICLLDHVDDLPWITAENLRELLVLFYGVYNNDQNYELEITTEENGTVVKLGRENGSFMEIDFDKDEIAFSDYDLFLHDSSESSQMDMLSGSGFSEKGEPELFSRLRFGSFERAGAVIVLSLSDYSISLPFVDGTGYIPLQMISDFILSPQFGICAYYNKKALFFANSDSFGEEGERTPLGEYYYSAQPCERSSALAEYGYHELCLAMDCLYGLKEIHDIDSFDRILWEIGYDEDLKSPDAQTADDALADFINVYLDDLHSGFMDFSWMNAKKEINSYSGPANSWYDMTLEEYTAVRKKYLGDPPANYMEVGNTAYITFDEFDNDDWNVYYEALDPGEIPEDTIDLIIYAHRQIYRDNSPIENVVFDLSCNGGGSVDAALFIISWVLGDTSFCIKNTFTGAMSNLMYRADVNLDREFNWGDALTDKTIFCLVSPLSFSCGNLLPAVFKNFQKATLIGRTTGGGSCTIMSLSTAWGSSFQISGFNRMSFFKNGSFYDIDQGIDPDIYLTHISSFYDREKLTEIINGLN